MQNLVNVSASEIGFIKDHFKRHRGLGSLLQATVNEQSDKPYNRRSIWDQLNYRPEGNDAVVINEARRLLKVTIGVEFDQLEEA
ncbi:hypothetical protein [Parapedobacter lycopersici]|uniref:hypothetical protein n=1 Tax=Parapedobacter lycopersici TaxID=1864939 RepID=UPI00214D1E38|nr:hypothetical protein [Parapedobacter lycopersici]